MALFFCIDMHDVKRDLLDVSSQCAVRGLTHSMKWSSELASSLTAVVDMHSSLGTLFTKDEVLLKEYEKYCVGKAFFDSKEYLRASHWLKDCESQLCNFLYFYSRYLDIQKKKRYHMVQILDGKSTEKQDWQELIDLRNDLKQKEDDLDSYGYYLYGIVLKSLDLFNEAIENLECSVQMQPLFWGAWHELSSLCKDRQAVKELKIPKHWMSEFFHSHVEIDLHMNEEALAHYQELANIGFAESTYVKSQLATALYNLRDFDASVEHFKQLLTIDPFMLEHVDTYSNILFIQDDRAELSYLAHHVCGVDKYRAESCGVIGNYYSLRGEHEKAVLYFKQALRLNPNYIAAWTLLGHEYVELRNTSAAIESYRRATELNSRDYRAWYGLGQTYEILKLLKNSLYYYREAQKLRPNDARLLIALGDTYQNIGKSNEAKKCYTRAVRLGDSEGQASLKLAKLQEIAGEMEEAAKLYAIYIDRIQQGVYVSTDDQGRASLFLARHHQKHDRHEEACMFARKAAEFSETKEEAKTLLAEMTKALKT